MAKKTAKYVVLKAAIFIGDEGVRARRCEIGETVELTTRQAKHFLRVLAPHIPDDIEDDEDDDAGAEVASSEATTAEPEPVAPEPEPDPAPTRARRRTRSARADA